MKSPLSTTRISRRTFLNLVVEPLIHRLHLFLGIRREQVIDSNVGRGYQDRLGVREGIVAVLPVVVPQSRSSHASIRHGLDEQKDIGLVHSAATEGKGPQNAIDH